MSLLFRQTHLFYTLLAGTSLAASLIWGIDTLMLLDAGLSNTAVFAVAAGFSVGMLLAEIPTGVIADVWGRRTSFVLGCLLLASSTLLYISLWYLKGPLWAWIVIAGVMGISYSFFTGALEAWIVDALNTEGRHTDIEQVLGRGQAVMGSAMLLGSIGGGVLAQVASFGWPYFVRTALLVTCMLLGGLCMRELGFKPNTAAARQPLHAMKTLIGTSVAYSLHKPAVRWIVLSTPLIASVNFYVFFALQPYLLELAHKPEAYSIAGIAAAVTAGAHMVGGLIAPYVSKLLRGWVNAVVGMTITSCVALILLGILDGFWWLIALSSVWAITRAVAMPPRQAFLNEYIPSDKRATVLSFDSLLGNAGGVPVLPALGKTADLYGYGPSLALGGMVQLLAMPILWRAARYDSYGNNKATR